MYIILKSSLLWTGVLSTSPEVQLYVVGSNGVLVPVETAMVLNTNIYHVLPCGTGSDVDSQTAKSQQLSTPPEAFQPIESRNIFHTIYWISSNSSFVKY